MNKKPECIGIVGGLGPFAGADLMRKIIRWTAASSDQEHPPVMLYSFPGDIPDRSSFLLGSSKSNPGEAIGNIMVQLAGNGASVIGMPCNTAHSPRILNVALAKLQDAGFEGRFVSIVESAMQSVRALCPKGSRIGLMGTLGTMRTELYQNALQNLGYESALLDEAGCQGIQEAISNRRFGVKACSDPVTAQARGMLLHAAQRLIDEQGVSAVLLGCTEIPVAITETHLGQTPIIDATTALAKELLRAACPQKLRASV